MKLKEYWGSWRMERKLRSLAADTLRCSGPDDLSVVVSLTSIPSRLGRVYLTIRSVLAQTRKPSRLVLWLNSELEGRVPASLQKLTGEVFEIRFGEMTCPHRKLIFALEQFPKDVVVTCDDDHMYHSNWLELLWREHQRYPNQIVANRCNLITCDNTGTTLPYGQWRRNVIPGTVHPALMPIGVGGVLYPPGALHRDVTNSSLFLNLAPTADDLWFKAMSIVKGTKCRRAYQTGDPPIPIIGTGSFKLSRTNIRQDYNRRQWEALRTHYDIIMDRPWQRDAA